MEFNKWMEVQLSKCSDKDIKAFNFNLYEGEEENEYDIQIVGCKEYSFYDDDWACDVQFSSEGDLFSFNSESWEDALQYAAILVNSYLHGTKSSNQLTNAEYVTAGFVDGDLEVIFQK